MFVVVFLYLSKYIQVAIQSVSTQGVIKMTESVPTNVYWGDLCDLTCPLTCFELNCNISTGHCLKCPLGVWGAVCGQLCPTSCYGGDCDKENNTCTHGCLAGKFGDTCEHNCSSWCEQHSGKCTGGCVQGWFGEQCDSESL